MRKESYNLEESKERSGDKEFWIMIAPELCPVHRAVLSFNIFVDFFSRPPTFQNRREYEPISAKNWNEAERKAQNLAQVWNSELLFWSVSDIGHK